MNPFKLLKSIVYTISTGLALGASPALAAGTIPLAMAQQIDINGQPLANCQVSFFVAGTVASPQNAYQDFGLTQTLPNPLSCDQSGRIPMFWLADGLIHVRLTDSTGLQIIDTTMQVLGPSSGGGGGGGGTVDPTTIASTGDLKWRLDKTSITGWVRINGLTIGSASSGASERANADTQNLYVYIWNNFSQPSGNAICPVVGGLGASALADFNANKQLTLDDARSKAMFAYDDMGNSAAGGFTGTTFTYGSGTTVGSKGGTNSTTILPSWVPTITGTGTVSDTTDGHSLVTGGAVLVNVAGGGNGTAPQVGTASLIPTLSGSFTSTNTGGLPMPSVPSMLLGTLFWKL